MFPSIGLERGNTRRILCAVSVSNERAFLLQLSGTSIWLLGLVGIFIGGDHLFSVSGTNQLSLVHVYTAVLEFFCGNIFI